MKRILLFLDFDGTLVPLERSPERTALPAGRKRLLKRLAGRMFVCIASGRSLREIRKLVGVESLSYIGNHGLEIRHARRSWVHPKAAKIRPILRKTLFKIRSRCQDCPGVLVEDKGVTGSIHYRRAPDSKKRLKDVLREVIAPRLQYLKITEGKKVFEIRPNLDWHKGKALQKLCGRLKPSSGSLRIYIGDDQTDEDAFKVLKGSDISILVGRRKRSLARCRLASVGQAWKFLEALFRMSAELRRPGGQDRPSRSKKISAALALP